MTTPVSFEIAKLLKEKGFNEQTLAIYQDGEILWLKSTISNKEFMTSRNYSAPTIAEVVMWLYEKHGIWVEVYYDNSKKEFYTVFNGEEYKFNSPTEAYEAVIEYCLTNIIK